MTPEEKLLRAIFGEKASDVRDTSLRVPPGVQGTIVEVRVFNRHGVDKDERAQAIEREEIERLAKDRDDEQAILDRNTYARLGDILTGKTAVAGPKGFKKDTELTRELLNEYPRSQWWQFAVADDRLMTEIEAMQKQYDESKKRLEQRFLDKVEKLQRGDELPPGVMKMVKVFVAVKRKIQPGDKMAGRHGNKGVVSKHRAARGHAVPRGRHACRHRAQPARRAEPHECRPDPRDASRLGGGGPRQAGRAGGRRLHEVQGRRSRCARTMKAIYGDGEIKGLSDERAGRDRPEPAPRRADGDAGVQRRQGSRHRAHARDGRASTSRAR